MTGNELFKVFIKAIQTAALGTVILLSIYSFFQELNTSLIIVFSFCFLTYTILRIIQKRQN